MTPFYNPRREPVRACPVFLFVGRHQWSTTMQNTLVARSLKNDDERSYDNFHASDWSMHINLCTHLNWDNSYNWSVCQQPSCEKQSKRAAKILKWMTSLISGLQHLVWLKSNYYLLLYKIIRLLHSRSNIQYIFSSSIVNSFKEALNEWKEGPQALVSAQSTSLAHILAIVKHPRRCPSSEISGGYRHSNMITAICHTCLKVHQISSLENSAS